MLDSEKKERFEKLCTATDKKVREQHKPAAGGFSLNAIQGWFRNQWNRPTRIKDIRDLSGRGGARVVSFVLGLTPFIGSALSMSADELIAYRRRNADEKAIQKDGDNEEAQGDFLIEHGMAAYVDAVRKANDAEKTFLNQPVKNCSDLNDWLTHFYYWNYRLERLQYYQDIVEGFAKKVAEGLEQSRKSFELQKVKLMTNGPKEIFSGTKWHENCVDVCVYPEHDMPQPLPPIPGERPVPGRVVPPGTGLNALPLPPRPGEKPVPGRVVPPGSGRNVLPLPPRPPKKA